MGWSSSPSCPSQSASLSQGHLSPFLCPSSLLPCSVFTATHSSLCQSYTASLNHSALAPMSLVWCSHDAQGQTRASPVQGEASEPAGYSTCQRAFCLVFPGNARTPLQGPLASRTAHPLVLCLFSRNSQPLPYLSRKFPSIFRNSPKHP